MKSLKLANGDLFPSLGLGTWKSEPGEVGEIIKSAIELGYRHLDCAAIYANEAEIGVALKEVFDEGKVKREELWITSKLWNNCHHPDHVRPAIEKTLADLQLDYLDLYLMHWPVAFAHECTYPETDQQVLPLAEIPLINTWKAMEFLMAEGLCRHLGTANFSTKKLQHLIDDSDHAPEVNQIEMHPYLQQPKMLEFCRQKNILLTAYAPLGSAGRPDPMKDQAEPVLLQDPVINEIARSHQVTPAQVLLQWGIARGTSVIPKTVSPKRLEENFAAANVKLSAEAIDQINQLDRHRRYFDGKFWDFPSKGYTLDNLWDET